MIKIIDHNGNQYWGPWVNCCCCCCWLLLWRSKLLLSLMTAWLSAFHDSSIDPSWSSSLTTTWLSTNTYSRIDPRIIIPSSEIFNSFVLWTTKTTKKHLVIILMNMWQKLVFTLPTFYDGPCKGLWSLYAMTPHGRQATQPYGLLLTIIQWLTQG